MKIHICCHEKPDGWILGKFATKLCKEINSAENPCDVSDIPDSAAEVNHYVNYFAFKKKTTGIDTLMITHIDSDWKFDRIREQLTQADMGICMSRDTMRMLIRKGIAEANLCYINPAHDGVILPRKIVIGITSRTYPDGCKREHMLVELAKAISPSDFVFKIMGAGWKEIVAQLRVMKFQVEYFDAFDLGRYRSLIPTLDYYLYFGLDEGSMGFLDACAAGVPTIVTPQGFHLDADKAITHAFTDIVHLVSIFYRIAEPKRVLQSSVVDWTWANYARKHLALWNNLLDRSKAQLELVSS